MGQPDFNLEPCEAACNIAIPGPDEQSEETCSTESTLYGWNLGSHPTPQITHLLWSRGSVHSYISCPSPLKRFANACERWSRVTVTQFPICFDPPHCHLLVVNNCFGFRSTGCVFPGGSRPKTKPGNKDSISRLIKLQICFGRTNHFITSYAMGYHASSE